MKAVTVRWRHVLGHGVAAALLATLTGHPICDLVFDCGCTWIFAGAERACDIHQPGPPDCPPCSNLAIGALSAAVLWGTWWTAVALAARAVAGRPRAR